MNSHVNYLMATQRTAELLRAAENARRANRDERAGGEPNGRAGRPARTVLRLRLRNAGSWRLRVRRA